MIFLYVYLVCRNYSQIKFHNTKGRRFNKVDKYIKKTPTSLIYLRYLHIIIIHHHTITPGNCTYMFAKIYSYECNV